MSLLLRAFAKLNLSLEVLGARDDGYHEIRSIVQTVDLSDRIRIDIFPSIQVSCTPKIRGLNLVEVALRELFEEKGGPGGARVHVDKGIPVGAGLGGGSSDAAAVLVAVNALHPPVLALDRLEAVAQRVGSDVPLFLSGGCMVLEGVGRPKHSLPIRPETFVVLAPFTPCATARVYAEWQPKDRETTRQELGRNDLGAAAMRLYPGLAAYRDTVRDLGGAYWGMTGSGSSFYAAFAGRAQAETALQRLTSEHLDARVYCCQPTRTGFVKEGMNHEDRD